MNTCNHPTECKEAHSRRLCNPTSIITMEDVESFFSHAEPARCHLTIAYIDIRNQLRKTTKVKARKVGDDCYLHFTQPNEYIYVYDPALTRLMGWVKDSGDMPFQAIVGNHLTIGYDDQLGWDIHERIYENFTNKNGHLLLSKGRNSKKEMTIRNNLLEVKQKIKSFHDLSTAHGVWNDICCWLKEKETRQQEGGQRRRRSVSREVKKKGEQELPSPTLSWMDKYMPYLKMMLTHCKDATRCAALRIPYLNNDDELDSLCETLYRLTKGHQHLNMAVVRDVKHKCAVLLANMLC